MSSRKVELVRPLVGMTVGAEQRILTPGTGRDSWPGQRLTALAHGSKATETPPSRWAGTVDLASPVWADN